MGRNEILTLCVSHHLGVLSISSSIIFFKEPSVNPIVGDPLQIVCCNINLLKDVLLLLLIFPHQLVSA